MCKRLVKQLYSIIFPNVHFTVKDHCFTDTECYTNSQAYDGRRVCTVTGRTCQRWDSQTPNSHNYTASELFPDDNATEASNYCRDPGGVKGQPWCYTTDPALPWDYCGIADCSGEVYDTI